MSVTERSAERSETRVDRVQATSILRARCPGDFAAAFNERRRHVAEDDLPVVSDTFERAEADQSIPGTNVENHVS